MTGLTEEKKFSSEKNRWLMLPVLLVIATFIISLGYGFVSDDRIFLIDNPNFLSQPILKYFQHGVWKFSALDLPEGQLYCQRPVDASGVDEWAPSRGGDLLFRRDHRRPGERLFHDPGSDSGRGGRSGNGQARI